MFIMHQANRKSVTARHPRRSFTLIELLMVIVIISILMSLAFAAFNGVMRTARVAEVKVEIDALSSALAAFKAKFGFFPPSRFRLVENPSTNAWSTQSRAVLRQMFPQFDFAARHDFNFDNDQNDIIILTGAECGELVRQDHGATDLGSADHRGVLEVELACLARGTDYRERHVVEDPAQEAVQVREEVHPRRCLIKTESPTVYFFAEHGVHGRFIGRSSAGTSSFFSDFWVPCEP